ncbi:hypothetical protein NC652_018709 [Populus alba x Populus x berolinensis]|nr:hypothetical protein NC652_018709 [Populus alba x Populus x berolinensis]
MGPVHVTRGGSLILLGGHVASSLFLVKFPSCFIKRRRKHHFPVARLHLRQREGGGGIARETKYSRRISFALIIKLIDLAIWLVVRYYRDYK